MIMSAPRSIRFHVVRLTVCTLVLIICVGCKIGSGAQRVVQSHFAYPNSNVIPIGTAQGSKSRLCGLLFINWGAPDYDDMDQAINRALTSTGGDLLINMRTDQKIFTIPFLFTVCITNVSGTAAKMEIGRQRLEKVRTQRQHDYRQPEGSATLPRADAASNSVPANGYWFYIVDGERKGPVSKKRLKNMVLEGKISFKTRVWNSNFKKWRPMSSVIGEDD